MHANLLPAEPLGPTAPSERIGELDVLRGFALFGILVVNMMYFAHPVYREVLAPMAWPGLHDRLAEAFVMFFGHGKFLTLFSLLFGIGLAMQMRRAAERGRSVVPLYLRRMLILFAFGAAHIVLLWFGDILLYYSILGAVLLLFRNRQPRAIMKWAAALIILPLVLVAGQIGLVELGRSVPEGAAEIEAAFAETAARYQQAYDTALEVYATGTFGEMVQQRLADYGFTTVGLFFSGMGFLVMAMFLVGLWVGRRGVVFDIANHLPLIRKTAVWGLVLGIAGNLMYVSAVATADPLSFSPLLLLMTVGILIGAPGLCLAYAGGLTLLLQRDDWRARLDFLAPVGRMALTNYILQSVIATTIFYGYGLGLYGRIGPAVALLLAILVFAVQVPLSRWWLARYRFGPLEWLWRTLTYGRAQPMRREAVSG